MTLAYGLLVRTQSRDSDLIGIGNGGKQRSVNGDDGNLNYSRGVVSNAVRATGELTLRWGPFGAYLRGYGYYDFETQHGSRSHRGLDDAAERRVGRGGEMQDYFVTARVDVFEIPVMVRLGNQVVNWGESNFLRLGVDVVNPIDFLALLQPTSSGRDLFLRQGMLWAAANLTETVSIEGFYQYDWQPARLEPTGWFTSGSDAIGSDGARFVMEGFGEFSDLGTDLDAFFDLPRGTLGFDEEFMRIPSEGLDKPSDQRQFGFAVQTIVPALNASKIALHFMSYHSRLPILMGRTASPLAVAATTDDAVDDRAMDLVNDDTGLSFEEARAIEETLTVGRFSNATRSFVKYPEDVRMLGLSFNTATVRTGTLVAGEIAHHFGWPVQQPAEQVIAASLSPIQFTDAFDQTSLGSFGPDEVVKGFKRADKTQASLSLIQLFGPRLGASQTGVGLDLGWAHFHDLPSGHPGDGDSWGYRLTGVMNFEGVLGGFSVSPRVNFTHDVEGTSPGPAGPFIENRKSLSTALGIRYTNTWTLDLRHTWFFGGGLSNQLRDRDFFRLNLSYRY